MSSSQDQDHLAAATEHLRAAFPNAEGDNDVALYRAVKQAVRDDARDTLLAHLRAQRSVLRILTTAAGNAPTDGRGRDPLNDAWWTYQERLQDAQNGLATLIDTLETAPPPGG